MFKDVKILLANPKALFFKNIGTKQTIFKNTIWLTLAEIIARLFGLILIIYVARILGATEYGKFTFALSFVSIVVIFSNLGLMEIATREFSRDKENEKKFAGIFTLQLVLCTLTMLAIIISSFFITSDSSIRRTIWVLGIFVLSASFLGPIYAFLRARQKMEYEAFIKIFLAVISAVAVLFVILNIPSSANLSYGYAISNLIAACLIVLLFSLIFYPLSLKWEKGSFNILKLSWPLSLGFSADWILLSINSVMLGYYNLIPENGWYGAAAKIAMAAIIPADLIIRSFFPALSNFFNTSKDKFNMLWGYLSQGMIFLAIPTIVGGFVLSPKIINSFYGQSYAPSILILQFMFFVVGMGFLCYSYNITLIVVDQQKNNFILIMLAGALNVLLDMFLIPLYGLYGALIAMIVSSIIFFVSTITVFKYKMNSLPFNKKLFKAFLIAIFSSVAMYFVITNSLIHGFNVIFICLIGIIIYFLFLIPAYIVFIRGK